MRGLLKEDGFSLVELLVVIAIVGLMMSVVVLSVPGEANRVKEEMAQTEAAMIAVSRRSITTGRLYGLKLSREGFEVQVLTDDGWQSETDILKPEAQSWAPLVLEAVEVEGAEVDMKDDLQRPHIWFLPTGEFPAFKLLLASADQRIELLGAEAGTFEVRYEE